MLKGLSVIECPYCYNRWQVDPTATPYRLSDPVKGFSQRRDVDLYRLCGIYGKTGAPVETVEVDHRRYPDLPPSFAVPRDFSDKVCGALLRGRAVAVAGGYCCYAPAVAGGIQRAIGTDKKLGVVWVDAHADNRIIETLNRPTRFVGFPLSALAGQTYPQWRTQGCGLAEPISGQNVLVSDGRLNDPDFDENMRAAGMTHLDAAAFDAEDLWRGAVEELAARVDALYLSVDADILSPEYIPAYEQNEPGGHDIDTVMRNIRLVMETGKVLAYSLFCVDFDHYHQGGEWTYLSGMKLLAAGLESWREMPEELPQK